MDGEARQRQYAEQLAARPTSSYTSLRPIEAYVRESDLVRPSTAYDFRGNSGGSQLGEGEQSNYRECTGNIVGWLHCMMNGRLHILLGLACLSDYSATAGDCVTPRDGVPVASSPRGELRAKRRAPRDLALEVPLSLDEVRVFGPQGSLGRRPFLSHR